MKSRRTLILLIVLVALIPLAIAQYLPPHPARTAEHVVATQHVTEQTQAVAQKKSKRTRKRTQTTTTDRQTFDASGHVTSATHTVTSTLDSEHATTDAAKATATERAADTKVDRTTTVEPAPLPRWTIGAGVGLDVFRLSPVYQVDVGYRVVGPFSVAGWAQVRQVDIAPTAGVSVRAQF